MWMTLAVVCVLGIMEVVRKASAPLPSFEGKTVNLWFEESLLLYSDTYRGSQCQKAFNAMEGDAVPYLTGWLNSRLSHFDTGYAKVVHFLPAWAQTRLPKPRDDQFYSRRSDAALRRLGEIGMAQRFKTQSGEPSAKPSVALAVPAMRAILRSTNESGRVWAAQAVWATGPAASEAIPELITLARDFNSPGAIQGLGLMGASASNAVPILTSIAMDDRNERRALAITALGQIGAAARSAAPALASLLESTNESLRIGATRTIASTGFTPDESVPMLTAMRQSSNTLHAQFATLALWNRDRQNVVLQTDLRAALQSDKRVAMLGALGGLGADAAPFVPEIKLLVNHPDPNASFYAKRALRLIQPATP